MRVGGIKQLQSFERRREWRDLTRGKLTVGIGFHMHTFPHSHSWCLCIAFPRSAVRRSARIRLIRSSWVARRRRRLLSAQYWARLLRKVLGRYQYHPILASIGQYPIPQYRYRSNPSCATSQLNIKRDYNIKNTYLFLDKINYTSFSKQPS